MNSFAGIFETNLTGLLRTIYTDQQTNGAKFIIPAFSDPLNKVGIADSDWTITRVDRGYSVSWSAVPTSGTYWETLVYISSLPDGTYVGAGGATNAAVLIQTPNPVWIKIRHRLITGEYSNFSNAKACRVVVCGTITAP
jgi:hypothetical protein